MHGDISELSIGSLMKMQSVSFGFAKIGKHGPF